MFYLLLKLRALLKKGTYVYIGLNLDFKYPLTVIMHNSGALRRFSV
jgi:hypothetical protein